MKDVRIIKKDGMYIPQFRKTFLFSKKHKWKCFTFEDFHYICSGFAESYVNVYRFTHKQEARNFLRMKGFKL